MPRPARPSTLDFKYNGGIAEFIKHLNRGKQVLHDKPIYMEAERDGVAMEIGLQYNDGYSESVFSFANNINTVDGGTHLSGFRTSLTRTINYAGQQMGLFKDVKENLTGDDVREGLVAVISVKLPQPQFEGQTKGKLNSDIAGIVQAFVNERLGAFFEQNSDGREERSSTRRSTPRARAKRRAKRAILRGAKALWMAADLPGKLADCSERDPEPLRTVPGRGRVRRRDGEAGTRPALPGDPAAEGKNSQRRESALRQDAGARRNSRHDHRARHRHFERRFRSRESALRQNHSDDRCRRGRIAHPHAAADVLLPPHAGADQARQRLHRAAAAVLASRRASRCSTSKTTTRVRESDGEARRRRA